MFLEKLQDWYGKYAKNFTPIYQSEDTYVYLVEVAEEIEFARIFKLGDRLEISIDRKIPITENVFQAISDAVIFGISNQWRY